VTIAAPDSRAALELALRLQSISLRNSCSEEFGGYAPASLETIIWQPGTGQHSSHCQGLIGGCASSEEDRTRGHRRSLTRPDLTFIPPARDQRPCSY